jgi:hypothetical protein
MRARAGASGDAFGDFLLQKKDGTLEQGTQGQGFFDDGRGDVVGEVSDDGNGAPLREVGLENIALDEGEPRLVTKFRAEILDQDLIDLDGDDAGGTGEEVGGEGASAGSDFDYDIAGLWARRFGDALEDFFAN